MKKNFGNLLKSSFKTVTDTVGSLTSSSDGLPAGTMLKVGSTRLEVVRKLAEGGFGIVYLVKEQDTNYPYALKRLLVNDPEDLSKVKEEIQFMKDIPEHGNIVGFKEAGISREPTNGSTVVLIIMEYCPEPSLYEILDSRFKQYFPEQEVLSIFHQICEGVAHLHSLSPPVAHRDLKVENVLKCQGDVYKLCDFGSATTNTYLPTTTASIHRIEDDIARYTTPTYRSPEMVDLWRKQPINEKADIWALGCLLFRICFFFHPFEEGGNLGILNIKYEIPLESPYSSKIHQFIEFMIEGDPEVRPTIYQVLDRLATLRGVSNNTKEPNRTPGDRQSPSLSSSALPSPSMTSSKTTTDSGDVFSAFQWHDSPGQSGASSSSNTAVSVTPTTPTPSVNDPFADFASATFAPPPVTTQKNPASSSSSDPFADFSTAAFAPPASGTDFFSTLDSPAPSTPSNSLNSSGNDLAAFSGMSLSASTSSLAPMKSSHVGGQDSIRSSSSSSFDVFAGLSGSSNSSALASGSSSPAGGLLSPVVVSSPYNSQPPSPYASQTASPSGSTQDMFGGMGMQSMGMQPMGMQSVGMQPMGGLPQPQQQPMMYGGMNGLSSPSPMNSSLFNSLASAPEMSPQKTPPTTTNKANATSQQSLDPFSNLRNLM